MSTLLGSSFAFFFMMLSLSFAARLIKRDPWKNKIKLVVTFGLSFVLFKALRRSYNTHWVIETISLRPDGKSVEISCHFPFAFRASNVPIKELKFLREDDLAR